MNTTKDTPKPKESPAYLGNTQNNILSNPCMKEQNLSMKCLEDYDYDKTACEVYFLNYKVCKAFWGSIKRERRAQGLTPFLPLPEDRAAIMAERLKQ